MYTLWQGSMTEEQMLTYINDAVLKFFDGDKIKVILWFGTENLNFGGASPGELINKGRIKRVYNFVKNAEEGNWP
jgi:hypothetical protein